VNTPIFPCSAQPKLFGTGKGREVKAVRQTLLICDTCPVRERCRRAGREGREFGIWGGETQPERWEALGITESDALPQTCGTEAALSRHKSYGETCETCEEAQQKREEDKRAAAASRTRQHRDRYEEIPGSRINSFHAPLRPVCGTESGYRAHLKRSELQLQPHPECTCRDARKALRAKQRDDEKKAKVTA
jgi:hypothetical protein